MKRYNSHCRDILIAMKAPTLLQSHPEIALIPALAFTMVLTLVGCSAGNDNEDPGFFEKIFRKETYRLYRIDIQQGNTIDQQKLAKLKLGMTKEQIRYLLGNPVSDNIFHKDHWYYSYYRIPGRGKTEKYRLILTFNENQLRDIKKSKALAKQPHQKKKKGNARPKT